MQFEIDYQAWLLAKAAPQSNSQKIDTTKKANKLLEWLIQNSAMEASQTVDEGVPVVENPDQEDPIAELLQDDTLGIGGGPSVQVADEGETEQGNPAEELIQDDTLGIGGRPSAQVADEGETEQENPAEELLKDDTSGVGEVPTVGGTPTEGATDEEETNHEKP